jgi:hypothetical protein
MQTKSLVSVFVVFFVIIFSGCGFFPDKEEVSPNWKGSIICSKTVENEAWHYKAYGDNTVKEMKVSLKKTSGNQDQWFGFFFDYLNVDNCYEFMINQKGKFRIARIIDGEEDALTLVDSQPGKTLNSGKGKDNVITIKIKDSKVDFYANIDEDDPAISEYFLGSIAYPKETLEHIVFAAYTGKETLAQNPLKVYITVFREEQEKEEQDNPYKELWQAGTAENSEEGWDIYYTASLKKLKSCDIKMLDDFYGKKNDNDVKHFTAKMKKESGAWNYGSGFVLSGRDLNSQGIPTVHYIFSIDTAGCYSAKRYSNMKYETAGSLITDLFYISESSEIGCKVSDKFLTGLGKENTFVFSRLRQQVISEDYYDVWYIWINPSEEITAENAEEKTDIAQLSITDVSDYRLQDESGKASGLVGFAPGVGGNNYEDFPEHPVLYKFKNEIKTTEETPEP